MSVKQFYFVLYTTCYLFFVLSMHIPARLQKISSKFDRKHWWHPKLCGCEFNLANRDHFTGANQVVQKVLCWVLCKCYCTFCKYVHLPCLHINLVEVAVKHRPLHTHNEQLHFWCHTNSKFSMTNKVVAFFQNLYLQKYYDAFTSLIAIPFLARSGDANLWRLSGLMLHLVHSTTRWNGQREVELFTVLGFF